MIYPEKPIEMPVVGSSETSIPQAVVSYSRDDDRSRYLGLRASGFTIREALGLLGKAHSTLSHWREDAKFVSYESRIPELKQELALEYAGLEFLRNMRLVLEKDFRVLKESLRGHTRTDKEGNIIRTGMDSQDFQYLLKLRPFYTPQQLQAIKQLFGKAGSSGKEVNWTDYVLTLKKVTEETVKVETRHRQESQLSPLSDNVIEGDIDGEA